MLQTRCWAGSGGYPTPDLCRPRPRWDIVSENVRAARTGRAPPVAFVHETWVADANQLSLIRGAVRRWLAPLGLTEDAIYDVVLAVDEAASNAIEHAYRPPATNDVVELTLWTDGIAICIEVVDHGQWRPPASPELTEGRGGGIAMMRQLIDTVIISLDRRGTKASCATP